MAFSISKLTSSCLLFYASKTFQTVRLVDVVSDLMLFTFLKSYKKRVNITRSSIAAALGTDKSNERSTQIISKLLVAVKVKRNVNEHN